MSNGNWPTSKPTMPSKPGNTLTQKIDAYLATWETRCYTEGIPDEVETLLQKSGRAPSYKAIAMAILKNDHHLTTLGFQGFETPYYGLLKRLEKNKNEE